MNKLLIVILVLLSLLAPILTAKPTLKEKAKAVIAKTAAKVQKYV